MTKIPSSRFFKTNWLNSHRNQCSKLTRNYYETIIIGDSIAAELSIYQNVWAKFLLFLNLVPLFLCHYLTLLHVILCLIMLAYDLSIFLILVMNFFAWFPVFYVVSLCFTKNTFHLILILVFNVSAKSNHHLVCNSIMSFDPVPVNVGFAPVHVRVNIAKSVSCHLRVSSLANPGLPI